MRKDKQKDLSQELHTSEPSNRGTFHFKLASYSRERRKLDFRICDCSEPDKHLQCVRHNLSTNVFYFKIKNKNIQNIIVLWPDFQWDRNISYILSRNPFSALVWQYHNSKSARTLPQGSGSLPLFLPQLIFLVSSWWFPCVPDMGKISKQPVNEK